MSYNVQGSITVKRLRTGATITLYFTYNGIALQQFVGKESGTVSPDWSVEGNQPEVIPQAVASNGVVTISDGSWTYNSTPLVFDSSYGTTTDGWIKDSTGRFAMNAETFALRIIDNLASKTNYASDTLEFTCICTLEGLEYEMSRSVDISILQSGATPYTGYLAFDTSVLTYDVTNTNIYAQLFDGQGLVSDFFTKWYKSFVDGTAWKEVKAEGTTATLNVTRDDVGGGDNNDSQTGGTLIICEFYLAEGDSSPVSTAAVTIADEADEYSMLMTITSDNKTVGNGKDVVVEAQIFSLSQQATITDKCSNIKWTLSVLDNELKVLRSVETQTITLTDSDVTADNDVNVVGDVQFDLNL